MIPEVRCILPLSKKEFYFDLILTKHQKIISKAFEKKDFVLLEKIFDDLLVELCQSEIRPSDLYIRDRQYALMMLRLESIKPDYPMREVCSNENCLRDIERDVDFSEYPFHELFVPINKKKLKINGGIIELEFDQMKRKDEMDVHDFTRKISDTDVYDFNINVDNLYESEFIYVYCAGYISNVYINGNQEENSFQDKIDMLNALSPTDFELVKKEVMLQKENETIDIHYQCNFCPQVDTKTVNWLEFFYMFMFSNINYEGIFMESGSLCFSDQINFNKEDVDNLPPFERQAYIDYFSGLIKEQERKSKEQNSNDGTIKTNSLPDNLNAVNVPQ